MIETRNPDGYVSYWKETTRPLTSLVFVLPFILIYEVGVLVLPAGERNGIEALLRWFLRTLGFGQYFLLPVLVVVILLAWHHTTGEKWRFRGKTLLRMLLESAGLGLLLLVLVRLLGSFLDTPDLSIPTAVAATGSTQIIAFFGAGIYEELFFRLIMLSAVAWFVRKCGVTLGWSLVVAVLLTSLVFSAAHYKPFNSFGDVFDSTTFILRVGAGVFFAMLFLKRGFGIAVGAHTLYDVFVSIP